jgi:hypothetical protein
MMSIIIMLAALLALATWGTVVHRAYRRAGDNPPSWLADMERMRAYMGDEDYKGDAK